MPLASRARPAQPKPAARQQQATTGKWDRHGREEKPDKPLGRAPKARVCYICGRQYMVHSFPIHEKQCIKLFEDREAQKPKKERKPVPQDPVSLLKSQARAAQMKQGSDVDHGGAFEGGMMGEKGREQTQAQAGFGGRGGGQGGVEMDFSLDAINAASQSSYSSATLSQCKHCNRTFLPEKLIMHNKMCTRARPARRVGEKVSADLKAEVQALASTLSAARGPAAAPRSCGTSGGGAGPSTNNTLSAPRGPGTAPRSCGTSGGGAGPSTNWRSKSGAFRAAIMYSKRISQAEARAKESGQHIDDFLAPPSEEEKMLMQQAGGSGTGAGGEALVQCPTCSRTFSQHAADRHIPKCKDIQNKPARLLRGTGRGIGATSSGMSPTKQDRGSRDSERDGGGGYISTHDSGMAVFERARVGAHQRLHPSPSTQTSHINTRPYGLSHTHRGSGGGARQRPEPVQGTVQRTSASASASSASGSGQYRPDMATTNGRKLQSLMGAKEDVNRASVMAHNGRHFGRK